MMTRLYSIACLVLLVVLGSCTAEVVEDAVMADGQYVYVLDLQGGVQDYAGVE